MFGYINANRKIMTPQDAADYQSFYCGLCQELKKLGGKTTQMVLNYDCAFLILLLSGLYEDETEEWKFTCLVHPTKKKRGLRNEFTEYAAAMDVILSYHNLLDDYHDNGSLTKKSAAAALRKTYEKIKDQYPRQVAVIETSLKELAEAEKRGESNPDLVADFTGKMLAEIFCYYEDDVWNHDLRNMGYHLGKFIYLMDAYEDREKDSKSGNYNPLIGFYQQVGDEKTYETIVETNLQSLVDHAARSFERMPILEHASIIRNILYSGIWTKYEIIQIKSGRRKAEAE